MVAALSDVNPTGDRYKPICTRNGTTCLKSWYLTFRDVSQSPTPKLARNAKIINTGRNIRLTDGTVRNHSIKTNIKHNDIKKSTRLVMTDAAGMIILGK